MKKIIAAVLCSFVLILTGVQTAVYAENTAQYSDSAEAVQQETEEQEEGMSKGGKIAVFLGIFTVSMGVTAYIVMRPKLKMLKEAKGKK